MARTSRSRPPLRRAASAALALLLLACDGGRRSSDGSTLEPPRSWTAAAEQWLSMDALPADTLSVTLLARGGPADLLSLGVRDPARVLVDAMAPERSLNRLLPGHGLVTGAIPSSTAALPLGSNLAISAVKLSAASNAEITVSAWVKRGSGGAVPAVQALPLAVLFVGGEPPGFDVALAELGRIWRAAGIEVGEPARLNVDGPALVSVDPALGSDSPAVGDVLRLSDRAPAGTLSLVVVGDLAIAGGEQGLWALAGAIPVPPLNGTERSGVVVGARLVGHDPIWGGQIIAHEVGHALGLYHTTEAPLAGGAIHDQIDDTPDCPADADRDGDGTLSAAECERHDAANLMFWATPRGATRLTAGQAAMARRSALVR